MGFDLYGLNPSNQTVPDCNYEDEETVAAYFTWQSNTQGAYFRQTVWGWKPIWRYVMESCSDIISVEDAERGWFNNGHQIDKEKAIRIAKRIRHLKKNGQLSDYAYTYKEQMDSLPDEECSLCKGTGTRKEWQGWKSEDEWLKYHDKLESGGPGGYKWAKKCKGCNGCIGKGKQKHYEKSYSFEEEEVLEFAEFCENSGGFKIC